MPPSPAHPAHPAAAPQVHGFPPLAAADATRLILGSMPGVASLRERQYYAHPRNAFWRIMQQLHGVDAAAPYPQRCRQLLARQIAVWDVLRSCRRAGSGDADIERDSVVANDFAAFFAAHRHIRAVYLNGGAAAALYRRHVLPALPPQYEGIAVVALPSTSPANAGMTFEQKLKRWRVASEQ